MAQTFTVSLSGNVLSVDNLTNVTANQRALSSVFQSTNGVLQGEVMASPGSPTSFGASNVQFLYFKVITANTTIALSVTFASVGTPQSLVISPGGIVIFTGVAIDSISFTGTGTVEYLVAA